MTVLKKRPGSVRPNGIHHEASPLPAFLPAGFSPENIRALVAELEVPFSPSLIEWRVMNTSNEGRRGVVAPYADPRAYTDRLNEVFTPAGWTRRYTVTISPNFERSSDKKLVAKIFVTCELTIHGIGSHSATGEEWTDNDHAGTSAEAQAFKRACSCFGLGRYLYHFTGIWVDLDERQRLQEAPELAGWATPAGWRSGLRPPQLAAGQAPGRQATGKQRAAASRRPGPTAPEIIKLVQDIEAMAETLGKNLYRGLLKKVANVWKPNEVQDTVTLERILTEMRSAEREVLRLEAARQAVNPEDLEAALRSLKLKSPNQVNSLELVSGLAAALEAKACSSGTLLPV
jgi:hypothetical protein